MSLEVISRPKKTISGTPSPFVCCDKLPIIYKMIRKDYTIDTIDDNGSGIMRVNINGNVASSFTNGDNLYIKTNDLKYVGVFTVNTSTYDGGATKTRLVLSQSLINGSAGAGYTNNMTKRTSYRVKVNMYKGTDSSTIIHTGIFSALPDGTVYIYLDGILISYLSKDFNLPFAAVHNVSGITNGYYWFEYQELWTEGYGLVVSESSNAIVPVFASLNLFDDNLPNLYNYSVAPSYKFIVSRGKKFVYGLKNYISALINTTTSTNYILKVTKYDKNGATVGSAYTYDFTLSTQCAVDFEIPAITDTTVKYCVVSIELDDGTPAPITELLTVQMTCDTGGPRLIWKGKYGGIDDHVFDISYEIGCDFDNGVKIKTLKLIASSVDNDEWEKLNGLFGSGDKYVVPQIEIDDNTNIIVRNFDKLVLMSEPNGNIVSVAVDNNEQSRDSRSSRHYFELDVEVSTTDII